ncbi:DNA polymerase III subunit gamma/tau [uncultured Eubacterium sp.]|uniref:DNA polymerase III subunit gamma/tau n=1 Tax=uncultured Eubacterium sp. TaxID=165185 RepID=UPI0015ABE469|nr:DNA polymerase III subunit gamma/tau [uncultured Eubacterium sp.]
MYQVLYRKYRPKVFSDVYGQDHVTSTLKNEIENGRVSHAYLFTGSRGTGKTTCAKILAKAVNCEHNVNGEPCNECEVCKGLDNGSIYDVVEIDAASNNGVDNIRELRDDTNYAPTRGKYRVYIIDEVHMLSTGAFNALLKTLEEPPAHVIFILATTEVHKLPATILSRCQRFDFKRIQPETMAKRLNQVAEAEGITLESDAALLIARIADGALRDGLSILDQCAGRGSVVNAQLVSEVAGLAGKEAIYKLSSCISSKDSSSAMSIISELYQNSYDMERLCVEMINHFRNFLVAKTVRKSRELIICTDDEYNMIIDASKQFTVESIMYALDLFQNTLVCIKGGASARIETEMAFVKLCEPKLDEGIDSLLDRLSKLENAVKNGVTAQHTQSSEPVPRVEYRPEEKQNTQKPTEPMPVNEPPINEPEPVVMQEQPEISQAPAEQRTEQPSSSGNETKEFAEWGEFIDVLHTTNPPLFGVLSGSKGYVRGDFFLIDSPNPMLRDFIKASTHSKSIKKALFDVTGKQFKLGLFKRAGDATVKKRDPLEDLINQASGSVNIEIK